MQMKPQMSLMITADDTELGSSVRFADVTAPPHWADRITGLVAAISAGADT